MLRSVVTIGLMMLSGSISASFAADAKARPDVFADNGVAAALKAESGTFTDLVAPSAAKVTLSDSGRSAVIGDQPSIKAGSLALSAHADAGSTQLDVIAARADAKTLDCGASIGSAAAATPPRIRAGELLK